MRRAVVFLLTTLGLVVGMTLAVSCSPARPAEGPRADPAREGGMSSDTATCTPTAARPGPVIDLGVQASTGTDSLPRATVDRLTASAQQAGAGVISSVVRFEATKSSPSEPMRLDSLDETLRAARAAGLDVRLTVYGMPDFAYDTAPSSAETYAPPRTAHELNHWRALLRELLAHVGPDLDYLEIWTEPNTVHYWSTGPDPAEFAELLRVSAEVVRAVSPRTRIISGGLSVADTSYFEEVVATAGSPAPYDLVGLHLFGSKSAGAGDWLTSYRTVRKVAPTMPIYLTALGYPVEPGLTDEDRAGLLTRALDVLTCTPYVEVASWYYLHPTPWDAPEWTLLDEQGTPNETWRALAAWSTAHRS